jgi:hypothetical protein
VVCGYHNVVVCAGECSVNGVTTELTKLDPRGDRSDLRQSCALLYNGLHDAAKPVCDFCCHGGLYCALNYLLSYLCFTWPNNLQVELLVQSLPYLEGERPVNIHVYLVCSAGGQIQFNRSGAPLVKVTYLADLGRV